MKNKLFQKIGKVLQMIFGTYTPPQWVKSIHAFIHGTTPQLKKARKITCFVIIGIIVLKILLSILFSTIGFITSKGSSKISVGYESSELFDLLDNPKQAVSFEFYGSVIKTDAISQPVTQKIPIKPDIPGTWSWQDTNILVFTPEQEWSLGTSYSFTFPKTLFADHVQLQNYTTTIEAPSFYAEICNAEFEVDPEDPSVKRISFEIQANFPINDAEIDKLITLIPDMKVQKSGQLEKRSYSFTTGLSENKCTLYVASESLGVPAKDTEMLITVKPGLQSTRGGTPLKDLKASVTIPGSESYANISDIDFSLVKDEEQNYEQIISIQTTAKISTDNLSSKLAVYELPVDLPAAPGHKAVKNYEWMYIDDVTADVLSKSKQLELQALPTELEYSSLISYKVHATPGRYLYIQIKEGAHFYGDYYLAKPYLSILRVKNYPKEVSILSEGTMLSMQGSHIIPVYTRGIDKVCFTVWRLKPEDLNHIVSTSNGNMKNFRFGSYNFGADNVSEKYQQTFEFPSSDPSKVQYHGFDFSNLLQNDYAKGLRNGLFIFQVSDEDNNYTDKRLILISDLGTFVKKSTDNSRDIFVQSIATGAPVGSVQVQVIARNGNVLSTAYTAGDGHAQLPALPTQTNNHTPVAITMQYGNDLAFIPYTNSDRTLDYSNFETGGEYGTSDPDKLHAYLFSDRGIYRPGDQAHIGLIIKAGNWNKRIEGTPLSYTITDPNGTEIANKEFSLGADGFEEIAFTTQDYSPTGVYDVSVYLLTKKDGKITKRTYLGSESVKIEEFLPDTLSIATTFDPLPNEGWIKPGNLSAQVTLRNLFGTPAAGNTVKAQMELTPGFPTFNKYKGYQFIDPLNTTNSYSELLSEQETDDNGHTTFDIDIHKFTNASYRLRVYTEGYEKGSGRSVASEVQTFVSPLDYMVGVKSDGDLSYMTKDTKRIMSFIAIDPNLQQIAVQNIKLRILENRYVSVLVKQPNGVYKYQSVKKEYPVTDSTISIPASGLQYALPVDTQGDFVLILENEQGLQLAKTTYSVIGEKNIQRSLSRTAELEIKTSKSDFSHGEQIQLFIKAPYAGSGLIAIERDKVYAYKWFTSNGSSTVQTITVPKELEGNGYVTVMYSRNYNSPEIYMSPFCYAAVPFSVSLKDKQNNITLTVPDEVKPGTDYTIQYKTSQKGKIALFAVDEGILQVARYTTPDPLSSFYKKRALEVTTTQLLDLVLPEYKILKTVTATGGGAGYDMLAHNLNPFKRKQNKPVAYWSGIIDSDTTTRSVTYHIPDYFNGTLRVMAVAVSDTTLGVARTSTTVKNTFVIVPNTPLFASPGDECDISVTVTNNEKNSGQNAPVTLSVLPSKHLSIIGDTRVSLHINEGQDATATFKVKANDIVGGASLDFIASSAKEEVKTCATLSVRPASPYQVWLTSGALRKDSDTIDVNRKLYDEYATRQVSLSYLPLALAKGLFFYLDTYPYGCSEQVTSAAYPYLFPDLLKDSAKTRADAQQAVDNVIAILQARQKQDGTIGYWTNMSYSYDSLDAYCALFLTDARERGYYVPASLMDRLLDALKVHAVESSIYGRAFSIYVLTRNQMVTTSFIENLRKNDEMMQIQSNDASARTILSSIFLAATYKMLQQDNEATALLSKIRRNVQFKEDEGLPFVDPLYLASLYLELIARHFPERLKDISIDQLTTIEKELSGNNYTSFSAAMTLIALQDYLAAVPGAAHGKYTITQTIGKDKTTLTPKGEAVFSADFAGNAEKLLLGNNEKIPLFYQVTHAGFMHEAIQKETKDGIEVYREFLTEDLKPLSLEDIHIGDTVCIRVWYRTVNAKRPVIKNVAIVDLLSAGLEADITSVREAEHEGPIDYVDVREDRLVLFTTANTDLQSFTYKAKAINTGSFSVPPLFAQAMYDNTIRAIQPQKTLKITGK
ncbi:MAG: alpha-2-macroglobulin family protein [Treponema sp.]|nr:alpha-2-macroglobulin family protein [Treponema sp.]